MSNKTTIEWTQSTWNPIRGCTKISQGCKNCYAEPQLERFRGVPGHVFEFGFNLSLAPDFLVEPLTWMEPRWIFANSISDLFHNDLPDYYIEEVCEAMRLADWHMFQVLTKRPARMAELLSGKLGRFATCENIWWGTSVEDAENAAVRIPELLRVPVNGRRFLSAEPLLGDLGPISLDGIGWVIAGGESGPGFRQVDRQWVRSCRDVCVAAGVPFFFKQWGGSNQKKKENGAVLDGQEWKEMPAFTAAPQPSKNERLRRQEIVTAKVSMLFPGYVRGPIRVQTPLLRAV